MRGVSVQGGLTNHFAHRRSEPSDAISTQTNGDESPGIFNKPACWTRLDVQKRRGELRYFQYPCLLTPYLSIYIYKAYKNGDENSGTFWDRLDTQRMRWEPTPQSPTLALFTSFSGPLLFHVVYVAWRFMMLFDVFWRFLLFLDFLMSFAVLFEALWYCLLSFDFCDVFWCLMMFHYGWLMFIISLDVSWCCLMFVMFQYVWNIVCLSQMHYFLPNFGLCRDV